MRSGGLRRVLPASREVELDPLTAAHGGQQAATRVKARLLVRRELAGFRQDVRARERRMAAQVDFHAGGEPAQIEAVGAPLEERRVREVHLACDVLHPAVVSRLLQEAHASGVATEGHQQVPWRHVADWRGIQARALLPAHFHEPRPQHRLGFGQGSLLQREREAGGLIDPNCKGDARDRRRRKCGGRRPNGSARRMRASAYVVRRRTSANSETLVLRLADTSRPVFNGARFGCRMTSQANALSSSTPARW